jgi:hypothetical protein
MPFGEVMKLNCGNATARMIMVFFDEISVKAMIASIMSENISGCSFSGFAETFSMIYTKTL